MKKALFIVLCTAVLSSSQHVTWAGGPVDTNDTDQHSSHFSQRVPSFEEACTLFSKGLSLYKAARKGGPSQLYGQAYTLFSRAALAGHVSAIFNLGIMHECGLGAEVSFQDALAYYLRAETLYIESGSWDKVKEARVDIKRIQTKIKQPKY